MRTTMAKISTGFMLLAALTLAGCSASPSAESTDTKTDSAAAQPKASATSAAAPGTKTEASADCAAPSAGQTVTRETFTTCVTASMSHASGYAATSSVMGMATTARTNLTDGKMSAVSLVTPMGEVIVVDGTTYVKLPGAEWKLGDPSSADPIEVGLSRASDTLASMDPTTISSQVTGDLTVTGTDKKGGVDVLVLTGTQEANGMSMDATYYVSPDWVVMGSSASGDVNGTAVTVTMDITEWNVTQDISAPL